MLDITTTNIITTITIILVLGITQGPYMSTINNNYIN